MQRTVIGTPGCMKAGVRLDHSKEWKEYIVRAWCPFAIGHVRLSYSRIRDGAMVLSWGWQRDTYGA